ncbi:MAG: hypothetical protein V1494_03110 [Candidatus Diapherotrites archaeon]
MPLPKKPGGYKPGKAKLPTSRIVLTEAEYRLLLSQGKPVPQGAELIASPVMQKTAKQLRIRFHADGSMEIPYFYGPEGKLRVRFLRPSTILKGIRLVSHQIKSVRSKIGQGEQILDIVSRMHHDLEKYWQSYNQKQRAAFTQYFGELSTALAKNPALLVDENKIHAIERFENARRLISEGNASAASATIRGIENNLKNWLRKLRLQQPRLLRRRALVIDKKFQKDARIFDSLDTLIKLFNKIPKAKNNPRLRESIAGELLSVKGNLFATGLSAFKQQGKIAEKAAALVREGDLAKAKGYIRDINKGITIAASKISPIYPDKLVEIKRSTDAKFKQTVLERQTVIFHDMLEEWFNPKEREKTKLMLETIRELSSLAESIGKNGAARYISRAAEEFGAGNVFAATRSFENAAVAVNPSLAKELNG